MKLFSKREKKEETMYRRPKEQYLWKYIPVGKHVLIRELEKPDEWEEIRDKSIVVKKATAREGLFFKGVVVAVGELVDKFKQGDLILFNVVEGFRFSQIISGKEFYFRIINQRYIIPATFKEDD